MSANGNNHNNNGNPEDESGEYHEEGKKFTRFSIQ